MLTHSLGSILACLFAVLAFLRYAAVKERLTTQEQKTASCSATGLSGHQPKVVVNP